MNFYKARKPIFLKTDTLGISLGAGLLQVRDSMNYASDKKSYYTILKPIALISRKLSNAEKILSQHRKITQTREVPLLILGKRGMHDH